jgi:hypothetical protein
VDVSASKRVRVSYEDENTFLITQQQKYQPPQPGSYSRIVKEEPEVIDARRQQQMRYQDELKRQIEERDKYRGAEMQQQQAYTPNVPPPPNG